MSRNAASVAMVMAASVAYMYAVLASCQTDFSEGKQSYTGRCFYFPANQSPLRKTASLSGGIRESLVYVFTNLLLYFHGVHGCSDFPVLCDLSLK